MLHIIYVGKMAKHWSRFTMKEVLKFFLGDESVNKGNAIEDNSLEYDGTTAVNVLTDTDNDVEDLSSEE